MDSLCSPIQLVAPRPVLGFCLNDVDLTILFDYTIAWLKLYYVSFTHYVFGTTRLWWTRWDTWRDDDNDVHVAIIGAFKTH